MPLNKSLPLSELFPLRQNEYNYGGDLAGTGEGFLNLMPVRSSVTEGRWAAFGQQELCYSFRRELTPEGLLMSPCTLSRQCGSAPLLLRESRSLRVGEGMQEPQPSQGRVLRASWLWLGEQQLPWPLLKTGRQPGPLPGPWN